MGIRVVHGAGGDAVGKTLGQVGDAVHNYAQFAQRKEALDLERERFEEMRQINAFKKGAMRQELHERELAEQQRAASSELWADFAMANFDDVDHDIIRNAGPEDAERYINFRMEALFAQRETEDRADAAANIRSLGQIGTIEPEVAEQAAMAVERGEVTPSKARQDIEAEIEEIVEVQKAEADYEEAGAFMQQMVSLQFPESMGARIGAAKEEMLKMIARGPNQDMQRSMAAFGAALFPGAPTEVDGAEATGFQLPVSADPMAELRATRGLLPGMDGPVSLGAMERNLKGSEPASKTKEKGVQKAMEAELEELLGDVDFDAAAAAAKQSSGDLRKQIFRRSGGM